MFVSTTLKLLFAQAIFIRENQAKSGSKTSELPTKDDNLSITFSPDITLAEYFLSCD